MRIYTTRTVEKFRDIALKFYRVYDRHGHPKEDQVNKVIEKLSQHNKKYEYLDSISPANQVILPRVLGISYDPSVKTKHKWRVLRYILYWSIPILLWNLMSLTSPLWTSGLENRLYRAQRGLGIALEPETSVYGIQWFIGELRWFLNGGFNFPIIWSVIVILLWLIFVEAPSSPYVRSHIRYLVAWFIGFVILVTWLHPTLRLLMPVALTNPFIYADPDALITVWTAIIFLAYVWIGNDSDSFGAYIGRYQDIWTYLTVVVVTIMLVIFSAYQELDERVIGLTAQHHLAQGLVNDLQNEAVSAYQSSQNLFFRLDEFKRSTQGEVGYLSLTNTGDKSEEDLVKEVRQRQIYEIEDRFSYIIQRANSVQVQATSAKNHLDGVKPADINAVELIVQTQSIISQAVGLASQLPSVLKLIEDELVHLNDRPSNSYHKLQDHIGGSLIPLTDNIQRNAGTASLSLQSIRASALVTYVWIASFFTILILFPWILLLLFLFRKRDDRTIQIRDNLMLLAPNGELLHRVLRGSVDHMKKQGRSIEDNAKSTNNNTPAPPTAQDEPLDGGETHDLDMLAEQAFGNFEYALSLLLLSAINALGWYFVFYPGSSLGLAQLIEGGGDITRITKYLTENVSPLTFGFVGAYFYMMQMLYRRYRDVDLYPTAFLQAAERLLRVFILSLVISVAASTIDQGWATSGASILAFVFGIFPRAGLRWVTSLVQDRLQWRNTQLPLDDDTRLIKLDGVNIWHEARLFDENVENIQNLADAQIERLVLRTHYPASQIVDWIDQATLYKHCGHRGEWFPIFRAAGIRTATDLLDRCGLQLLSPKSLNNLKLDRPDPDKLDLISIVNAINDANAPLISGNGSLNGRQVKSLRDDYVQLAAKLSNEVSEIDAFIQRLQIADEPTNDKDGEKVPDVEPLNVSLAQHRASIEQIVALHSKVSPQFGMNATGIAARQNTRQVHKTIGASLNEYARQVDSSISTIADLPTTNAITSEGITQILPLTTELKKQAQSINREIEIVAESWVVTPVVTADMLKTIFDCIWPDNNMPYVLNYYFTTGARLRTDGE